MGSSYRVKGLAFLLSGVLILFALVCCATAAGSKDLEGVICPAEVTKISCAVPLEGFSVAQRERKLLVFNRCEGYKHKSIPYVSLAIKLMGEKTGAFEAVESDDMSVFDANALACFDGICFNNTTRLEFSDNQRKSLMDFVKGGGGIVGIHAATDNFYDWPGAVGMMGGVFDGHPWTYDGSWAMKVVERNAITRSFDEEFRLTEEIYRTKMHDLTKTSRILMVLDMEDAANLGAKGVRAEDKLVPLSWVRNYGKGRVFYSAIGHNKYHLWDKRILSHYLSGIQFALGDLEVDTTPNFSKSDNCQVK
jgi:hypothetical protein